MGASRATRPQRHGRGLWVEMTGHAKPSAYTTGFTFDPERLRACIEKVIAGTEEMDSAARDTRDAVNELEDWLISATPETIDP